MNSYLFEMSKRDERLMNIALMALAFLTSSYLGLEIYDRQTKETPVLEQNITDTVTKQRLSSKQPVATNQNSRYNIQLKSF